MVVIVVVIAAAAVVVVLVVPVVDADHIFFIGYNFPPNKFPQTFI